MQDAMRKSVRHDFAQTLNPHPLDASLTLQPRQLLGHAVEIGL
jgi:hypothetical protein